jgi:hypothetical protein
MRAISRFPLPDSHVSLSAVLEPGPNPQPAPPPRTAPGQSNLPQNQRPPQPRPIPTDTPRHHNLPRPQTRPPTPLPDCCATQTDASLRLGAQPPRLSPASSTNPQRQSNTTRDLHAPKAHNRRRRRSPLPAKERQIASTNSFRLKLQPPPPRRRSTSKVPNRPGQHCDAETATPAVPKSSPRPYPANDLNIAQPARTPPGHWNR